MAIHKWVARLACALALLIAAPDMAAADPYRPAPWIADLDQMRDALTAGYANLEWQAERGFDLKAAYARARLRLEQAHDEADARRAMERFIRGFADGHLEIRWPAVADAAAFTTPSTSTAPPPAIPLCERLGVFDPGDTAIASRLSGFRAVGRAKPHLAAGVVSVAGRKVGVLRIPIFTAMGFPSLCNELTAKAGLAPDAPCDDLCADKLRFAADTAFALEMRDQLVAVVAERPDVLLVDIAGNGGGNDSAEVLTHLVSPLGERPMTWRVMRGAPAEGVFRLGQEDIRVGVAASTGAQRDALLQFDTALTAARVEAQRPCDRSALWRGEPIACSGLFARPIYQGPLPARPADGSPPPSWAESASAVAHFPSMDTLWRGPLVVLVDWNSASASELVAARLQDAGAAVILGSTTFGAGCGHLLDRPPTVLANSRAELRMPDCVRLRADGSNEVAGVQPDVAVGLRTYDTGKQRVDLVTRALPAAMEMAIRRAR